MMYTFDIFITNNNPAFGSFIHCVSTYAFLLQKSGQIFNDDYHLVQKNNTVTISVYCAEKTSLNPKNNMVQIDEMIEKIETNAKTKIKYIETGFEAQRSLYKLPKNSSFYVLYSRFKEGSPLLCGDTFMLIPPYKIPYTDFDEMTYDNLNFWDNDYQRFFGMWMNGMYEEFAQEQLQNPLSKLNVEGRKICAKIEKLTGVPTYYFLFNYRNWTAKEDRERKCPMTGNDWIIKGKTDDDYIAFKCDESRLVSELSSNTNN